MRAAIHQPCYMPWLGLIKKASMCDVFVFMDDAQYSKSEPFAYNEIKTPQGRMRLRVPVIYRHGDTIAQVRPNYGLKWREKHQKALRMNYSNADNYAEVSAMVDSVLSREHDSLSSLNVELTMAMFEMFGIRPEIAISSELGIRTRKERRVIDICRAVGADVYISGTGAASYQSTEHFEADGVQLVYSRFEARPYKQMFGGFVPNLSAIDYLMNCGGEL